MVAHKRKHKTGNVERSPGILFTTSTPSKLQPSANVVLGLLDAMYHASSDLGHSEHGDTVNVSDALAQELSELSKASRKFRFTAELSRGIGLISVPKPLVPTEVVHSLLTGSLPSVPPMFVSRVIPVDFVCAPNVESFKSSLLPMIQSAFTRLPVDTTWKVVLDKHGLTNLTKEILIDLLQGAIPERHEVSIYDPNIVIMVQITQQMCGVGLLKDYDALCEYNLRKRIASSASDRISSIKDS